MITASNSMMAQGIKSLGDQIGGALKERAKQAKLKKKEGDLSRSILSLAFEKAESDSSFKMPTITDAEGNIMDVTKEEIPNLTYDQAVPAAQALNQFANLSAQLAKTKHTQAQTGTELERPDYIKGQIDLMDEQANLTQAKTTTEGEMPGYYQAQGRNVNARTGMIEAQTMNEAARGHHIEAQTRAVDATTDLTRERTWQTQAATDFTKAQTDQARAQTSGIKARTGLTDAEASLMWQRAGGYQYDQQLRNQVNEATYDKMTADLAKGLREKVKDEATIEGKRLLATAAKPFISPLEPGSYKDAEEQRQLFTDIANNIGPDADWDELVKFNNTMIEGRKNQSDWETSAVVLTDSDGNKHPMLYTSAKSAIPAPKGKGYNQKKDMADEAIPGSKGKRRGIWDDESGTWRNVYTVDSRSLLREDADIQDINDKLLIAEANLAALKKGASGDKPWKQANYNNNPAGEDYPMVVKGEGGSWTPGSVDMGTAIAQEQARVNEYKRQLGGGEEVEQSGPERPTTPLPGQRTGPQPKMSIADARQSAQKAIASGAPAEEVRKRFKKLYGEDL
tara:strand:- start:2033 stop:3727 length:1695 start_codon:yes stop_codon:yes gene_type:complete